MEGEGGRSTLVLEAPCHVVQQAARVVGGLGAAELAERLELEAPRAGRRGEMGEMR